jgi:hypothetical protein
MRQRGKKPVAPPPTAGTAASPLSVTDRSDFAVPPREWVNVFLVDRLGAGPYIDTFLQRCDASPTLAQLAREGPLEAFQLAVMALAEVNLVATTRRMERVEWETTSQAQLEALEAWLKRAEPAAREREAMGPRHYTTVRKMLSTLIPPPVGRGRAPRLRLLHELHFALSYVPGLTSGRRDRTVAALVSEWTGEKTTPDHVRLSSRRERMRAARRMRLGSSTTAIYLATLAAEYLARAGRLHYAQVGDREGAGIGARVCKVKKAARADLLARLEAAGLTVLPAPPRARRSPA